MEHIAILPIPAMGHLTPLGEFAKLLLRRHGITSTFVIPTDGPLHQFQLDFFSSLPAGVDHLLLPPVNLDDLPSDVRPEIHFSLTITRSLPDIRRALESLQQSKKVAAFVVDLFCTEAFDATAELLIPRYIFFVSPAMVLSMFFYLPELDKTVSCEYRDLPEKIQIPGCLPIHGGDLIESTQDRKSEAYKFVIHQMERYSMADGIVVNSFRELEPGPIEFLLRQEGIPPVFPIGPLIRMESKFEENGCSEWLDDQPRGSVLYVSFGSVWTLSHAQILELASGLEMSEQRFLWVLRLPGDTKIVANHFHSSNKGDPLAYLPEGFVGRTKGRGLVVPFWAPQAQILAHQSTGALLTHCGWNSTLESIANGVPMIAWPLVAENKMIAVIIHEDAKVGLRVRPEENGLIGRAQIANAVKRLMEGEEGKVIRSRMGSLKDAAARTLSGDGESIKLFDELVLKWKCNTSM